MDSSYSAADAVQIVVSGVYPEVGLPNPTGPSLVGPADGPDVAPTDVLPRLVDGPIINVGEAAASDLGPAAGEDIPDREAPAAVCGSWAKIYSPATGVPCSVRELLPQETLQALSEEQAVLSSFPSDAGSVPTLCIRSRAPARGEAVRQQDFHEDVQAPHHSARARICPLGAPPCCSR